MATFQEKAEKRPGGVLNGYRPWIRGACVFWDSSQVFHPGLLIFTSDSKIDFLKAIFAFGEPFLTNHRGDRARSEHDGTALERSFYSLNIGLQAVYRRTVFPQMFECNFFLSPGIVGLSHIE